jgi:flagellar FliL protein
MSEEPKKEEPQKEEPKEGEPSKDGAENSGGESKKKIIIIAIVLIIAIGAGAFFFLSKKKSDSTSEDDHGEHKKEEHKKEDEHGKKDAHGAKSDGKHDKHKVEEEGKEMTEHSSIPGLHGIFYDMPDFVVNLSNPSGKMTYLKLSVTIKLQKNSDATLLLPNLPVIRDNLQIYLRTLKESDLEGSESLYMLKDEILKRINNLSSPVEVEDILIKDIIIN